MSNRKTQSARRGRLDHCSKSCWPTHWLASPTSKWSGARLTRWIQVAALQRPR